MDILCKVSVYSAIVVLESYVRLSKTPYVANEEMKASTTLYKDGECRDAPKEVECG